MRNIPAAGYLLEWLATDVQHAPIGEHLRCTESQSTDQPETEKISPEGNCLSGLGAVRVHPKGGRDEQQHLVQ